MISKTKKLKPKPSDAADSQHRMRDDLDGCEAKAQETTSTSKLNAADDPVFDQYGEPFVTNDKGQVHINERAVAVKCAREHLVKYDPDLRLYEHYDADRGLWKPIHEVQVRRLLSDLLLRLGEESGQQEFVQRNKNSQFSSLAKMLQPHQADVAVESVTGLFHVSNGVLDLRGKVPKLMPHDPKYPFRHSAGVKYDPQAKCPKFTGTLLGTALSKEDILLLHKYFGSVLLGPNSCHGILLIRGTAGGGKSTLISVIEKVFGEDNVAELHTQHLTARFEASAFLGKRMLVGKDVPGDMLAQKGARKLKSLTGGDLLQVEIKYSPVKQDLRGDYHVVIASNNRLKLALDGDEDAWGRRLLIVDFENERPTKPIPNFADLLVAEEGSGILNWLIQGALKYRAEMNRKGTLALSERQQQRVAELLHDSDSILSFVEECITRNAESDVSSDELLLGYYECCRKNEWTPVSGHNFRTRVGDVLCERFYVCSRHDIQRNGKAVRGFKGLALN